jgi:tRNA nucleotidyltransferase/poly(A) polymerase
MVFRTRSDIEVYIAGGYVRDVILGKRVIDKEYIIRRFKENRGPEY